MFLCMSAITGIGFLIKYTLISGQERWIVYNDNIELYFWGMDRHEWGTIHLIIGCILLGLLILHIVLHWNIIIRVYRKMFRRKLTTKFISILFITICALFIIVPFLINPKISKAEHGAKRHLTDRNTHVKSEGNITCKKEELNNADFLHVHKQANLLIEIRGYMTQKKKKKKNKIPTEFIKTRLNIPKSVSCKQKMSWLKKRYPIKMHDVEKIIIEYQEKE